MTTSATGVSLGALSGTLHVGSSSAPVGVAAPDPVLELLLELPRELAMAAIWLCMASWCRSRCIINTSRLICVAGWPGACAGSPGAGAEPGACAEPGASCDEPGACDETGKSGAPLANKEASANDLAG